MSGYCREKTRIFTFLLQELDILRSRSQLRYGLDKRRLSTVIILENCIRIPSVISSPQVPIKSLSTLYPALFAADWGPGRSLQIQVTNIKTRSGFSWGVTRWIKNTRDRCKSWIPCVIDRGSPWFFLTHAWQQRFCAALVYKSTSPLTTGNPRTGNFRAGQPSCRQIWNPAYKGHSFDLYLPRSGRHLMT